MKFSVTDSHVIQSQELHDLGTRGTAFIDHVYDCLIVAQNCDPFAFPQFSPHETCYCDWINFEQSGGGLKLREGERPFASVRGKPRNLNQKRTQTRPKAVGTICPSDVAGREI